MRKLIGVAATAVAAVAVAGLAYPGVAAATQGPHHHPTAVAGARIVTDDHVTVYRDLPSGHPGTYRWCVTNYHPPGALTYVDMFTGTRDYDFPHGGGHTTCTKLYRTSAGSYIHVTYSASDGLDYGLKITYKP